MDIEAIKKGLAKFVGGALTQADTVSSHQRKYALIISIPITAPNKRLVEDQCRLAAQKVEAMSSTLIAAAGIDNRIQVDGPVQLKVAIRK